MKAVLAKALAWSQLVLVAINESLQANGIPKDAKGWLHILASAALAYAIHHAASTDGSK